MEEKRLRHSMVGWGKVEELVRLNQMWHAMQSVYWNKQPAELLSAMASRKSEKERKERACECVWEVDRKKKLEWSWGEEELWPVLPTTAIATTKGWGEKAGLTTTNYRPWHGCWFKSLQRIQSNRGGEREQGRKNKRETERIKIAIYWTANIFLKDRKLKKPRKEMIKPHFQNCCVCLFASCFFLKKMFCQK